MSKRHIKFKTHEAGMQHPQESLIISSLWSAINASLDKHLIPLITAPEEKLSSRLLSRLSSTKIEQRLHAWIAIVLSHPNMKLPVAQDIARRLELDEVQLFTLLAHMGNLKWMDSIQEDLSNRDKAFVRAYYLAALNGYLNVLLYLESKAPHLLLQMLQAVDLKVYHLAAECGRLDIFLHLESKTPGTLKPKTRDENFGIYLKAAVNGHLNVLQHLESKEPNLFLPMIQKCAFVVYGGSASNGRLEVLQHFESKAPTMFLAMVQADNFFAYRMAASNGHLHVLQHLESNAPNLLLPMIQADDFFAYRMAASNGHLHVLQHLESNAPNLLLPMIQADDFFAYRMAASNGHLHILQHLESKAPNLLLAMIQADNFLAYQMAASNGHLHVLRHLEFKAPNLLLDMIQANDFHAYRRAALNGHLHVLQHLESKAPNLLLPMIQADNFLAYRMAASNGHLHVLRHLEFKAPTLLLDMIQANDFHAYRMAISNGHLHVLRHLESKAPNLLLDMIQADNFYAYRRAVEKGYSKIAQKMWTQNSACFGYAETNYSIYNSFIRPFMQEYLVRLRTESSTTTPPEIFNVPDGEPANMCFYMARHLIRLNQTDNTDLRFLLNIPSVRAIAHYRMDLGRGCHDSLLKTAQRANNTEAVTMLLDIPEVRRLAEQHDFFYTRRTEIRLAEQHDFFYTQRTEISLAELARNPESSMGELTQGEQRRLKKAMIHYQPGIDALGIRQLIDDLRQYLIREYKKQPASIKIKSHGRVTRIILPMDFAGFERIILQDPTQREAALKAYYVHPVHTAWRYLQKPNLWMHPQAYFVVTNPANREEKWSSFEKCQSLIALLWLAVKDEETPPTHGHTLQTRIAHFIKELALIERAHNWDQKRINARGVEEEYDDLTGDRPSCFPGMKRRLFQAVLGHPIFTILTREILSQEARDFVREYFNRCIKRKGQKPFKHAMEDYFANTMDLSESSKEALTLLNIPEETIRDFEEYLSTKYALQYTEDLDFQKYVSDRLTLNPLSEALSDRYHALMLDGFANLYESLLQLETTPASLEASSGAEARAFDGEEQAAVPAQTFVNSLSGQSSGSRARLFSNQNTESIRQSTDLNARYNP